MPVADVPPRLSDPRRHTCHADRGSHYRAGITPRLRKFMSSSSTDSASPHIPQLKRLVPRLRGQRLGVVGDLMLDRYLWGTASRLSPEAAVPVVDFAEQSECLGGAGNVAANLAALGARVQCFGVVGKDEAAKRLRKCLRAVGIEDDAVLGEGKRV